MAPGILYARQSIVEFAAESHNETQYCSLRQLQDVLCVQNLTLQGVMLKYVDYHSLSGCKVDYACSSSSEVFSQLLGQLGPTPGARLPMQGTTNGSACWKEEGIHSLCWKAISKIFLRNGFVSTQP